MDNNKGPIESFLGKSNFTYQNRADPSKNVKALMCDHEAEGKIEPGYFIISKPVNPQDHENMEDEKIGSGEVMVHIPEQCLERMANHLDIVKRKRHELQQQEAIEERRAPISYKPNLRP